MIRLLEFHTSFYFVVISFLITGYYANLFVFVSLILVHEFGHYIVAKILGVKVKKIIIYPYGGMTKLEDKINLRIDIELLIACTGIIMEYIFFMFILILYKYGLVREYIFNLYKIYNTRIIVFNLLPIYPLDGEKIFKLVLDYIFPYKISNYIIM